MKPLVALLALMTLGLVLTTVPPAPPVLAASGVIVINAGCGTPSPLPSTNQQVTYVDSNGNLCVNTSGGSGGVSSITPVVSTAVESNHVLKAAAGNLYDLYVTTGSTAGYLMTFNATSAPADGAVTPIDCVAVPANATGSIWVAGAPPAAFSTGITAVFSSTGCFTKTASATAFFHGRVQ